ncbi:MAG: LCP family protein, partial [Clostridia bacterium]|nr:LCP family protein [Clostridia bacterium]
MRSKKQKLDFREKKPNWFSRKKTWQKVLIVIGLIVLVLGLAVGGYAAYQYSKLDKLDSLSEGELSCVDVDGYVNILLLGVDSRNMDDIQGTGADAIMILSLKEETGEVTLTSIYRDTYLKMADSDECHKITDINRIQGPEGLMKTLNEAMDLNISKYAVVNFKAVADLVNAVDGITVNVEDYEIEQLNKYTRQTAHNIGQKKYNTVSKAGEQTLEGVQAVSYGRIRKGVGDDFKRTERMRTVLNLVMEKLQLDSLSQLNKVMDAVLPNAQTNLGVKDMAILASKLKDFKITQGEGWPYAVTTGMLGSVSYVFADNVLDNVVQLHEKIFGQKNYDPSTTAQNVAALIEGNKSGAADQKTVDPVEEGNKDNPNKPETTDDNKSDNKNNNKDNNSNNNGNNNNNKNNNNNNGGGNVKPTPTPKPDPKPEPTPKPD